MPNQYDVFTDKAISQLSGVDIASSRINHMEPILEQVYAFADMLNAIDVGETPSSVAFNPLWEESPQ